MLPNVKHKKRGPWHNSKNESSRALCFQTIYNPMRFFSGWIISIYYPPHAPPMFFSRWEISNYRNWTTEEGNDFLKPGLDFGWALLSELELPAILDFLIRFPWANYKTLSASVSSSIYKIVIILSPELIWRLNEIMQVLKSSSYEALGDVRSPSISPICLLYVVN